MPTRDAIDAMSYAFNAASEDIDRISMISNKLSISISDFLSKLNTEYSEDFYECLSEEHDVQAEMSFEDAMKFYEEG